MITQLNPHLCGGLRYDLMLQPPIQPGSSTTASTTYVLNSVGYDEDLIDYLSEGECWPNL